MELFLPGCGNPGTGQRPVQARGRGGPCSHHDHQRRNGGYRRHFDYGVTMFQQTIMGQTFFNVHVPRAVKALERIADALERANAAPKPEPKADEKPA